MDDALRNSDVLLKSPAEEPSAFERARFEVLAPGTPLGRYVIQSFLGAGQCAAVYAADGPIGNVAIKVPHACWSHNAVLARHEATVLGRAACAAVVQLCDYADKEEPVYLVLERVRGQNLETMLRLHGPVSLAFAVELAIRLGRVVVELERSGIVHRDLKPENCIYARTPRDQPCLRVCDMATSLLTREFGEARSPASGVVGSIDYMPAEQYADSMNVDSRADVHAVSVILCELLTGDVPTRDEERNVELDWFDRGPARRIPRLLRRILKKGVAPLKDRYTPAQFLAALEHYAYFACLPRGDEAFSPSARRRPYVVGALLLAIFTVGVSVGACAAHARGDDVGGGQRGTAPHGAPSLPRAPAPHGNGGST